MQIGYKSLRKELRSLFNEKVICSVTEEAVTTMSKQIKYVLKADCAAIYLYNSLKDDFELSSTSLYEQSLLKKSLYNEGALSRNEENLHIDNSTVRNGDQVYHTLPSTSSFLIPLNEEKDERLGFLFISYDELVSEENLYGRFEEVALETNKWLKGIKNHTYLNEKSYKNEMLYQATAKFHSSMRVDNILTELVQFLTDIYPQYKLHILLSQNESSLAKLPIKELNLNGESSTEASTKAFLTGTVQLDEGNALVYAPLCGKQAIYGVLQITNPYRRSFPKLVIEFITMLANAAGQALENAKLYKQSKQLIADLQLINEASHTLNSNLRLTETTAFMKNQIKQSFGAEEVGFLLFKVDEDQVLEGSTEYFLTDESMLVINRVLPKVKADKEALIIGDFGARYSDVKVPYRSVMVVPMLQRGQVKGAVIVLHRSSYYFSFASFKLIKSLVHHSTLAFVNSMLREQLETLVITDYLTKLYSRKYLDEKLQDHFGTDEQGTFLLIDIDNFKQFNDTYGHEVGDELIIQVANIIKTHIGPDGFAARWGGEELAVYLPNQSITQGLDVARRIVCKVKEGTEPSVTVSVGVSYWQKDKQDEPKSIFERADQALYEAKDAGKNCVVQEKGRH